MKLLHFATEISDSLPEEAVVRWMVLNALGGEVCTLVDAKKEQGYHSVTFNASHLPSGVYYYRLIANGQTLTRKMTILK